jgi:CIC family chloride channel protein
MLAVGLSYLIVGDNTIYSSQIPSRADSPAHRAKLRFPLLSSLTVAEAQQPVPPALSPGMRVSEAEPIVEASPVHGAPVVNATGHLLGVFTTADLRALPLEDRGLKTVGEVMNPHTVVAYPTDRLDVALETLATHRVRWLPVLASPDDHRLVGLITAADVVRTYRSSLNNAVRGVSSLVSGSNLLDLTVAPGAAVAGRTLGELRLMPETFVMSIKRADEVIVPTASTQIRPGDMVTLLNRGRSRSSLHRMFQETVANPASDTET